MAIKDRQSIEDTIRNMDKFNRNNNLRGATDSEWWCSYCKNTKAMYRVFSYQTIIGQKCLGCGHIWINKTKYSATTNQHQWFIIWAWDIPHVKDEDLTVRTPQYRGDVCLSHGEHQDDRDYLTKREYTIMWSLLHFLCPELSPVEETQQEFEPTLGILRRHIRITLTTKFEQAFQHVVGSKARLFTLLAAEGWDASKLELAQTLWDRFSKAYEAKHQEKVS